MKRGAKFLVSATVLAMVSSCGQDGKLDIRSTPTPIAQGKKPVPARIAEARGQFALGNVALALSAYRMAARDNPNSTDALLGIAACYDQMGRFDLSRRSYEAALALAPSDTQILTAFVGSLQLQGRTDEALAVRQEIAARAAASQALDSEEYVAELAVPAAPAKAASQAPESEPAVAVVELPARSFANPEVNLNVPAPSRVSLQMAPAETGRVEMVTAEPLLRPVSVPAPKIETAAVGPSVSMKLPAARPVQPVAAPVVTAVPARVESASAPAQPMRALTRPADGPVSLAVIDERGPYLERISMGEIALVTVPKPVWRSTTVALNSRSTTVRFVPLREASTLPVKVRLLNAARVNRLAARTRIWLNARGWRGLAIGNAMATRARSVILYPAGKRMAAQRLAAQFGFPMAPRAAGPHIIVLLGTDAARRPSLLRARA